MKITQIIGEPATGKSTLTHAYMAAMGNWIFHQPKYIPHHEHIKNGKSVLVMGRYDDATHKFPGTDRMSMAAQPRVLDWLNEMTYDEDAEETSVILEGDRLGGLSFIRECRYMMSHRDVDYELIVLRTHGYELVTRRGRERQDQSEKFVRSRQTKVSNILSAGVGAREEIHNDEADTQRIVEHLIKNRS